MITGWGKLSFEAMSAMETHIAGLGYTVYFSNIFPASLSGYEILILVGGFSADEDIPEAAVDNFVNSGGGLLILEGVIASDDFDETANSSPVLSHTGWDLRNNANVVDAGNSLCTGISTTCTFSGYSVVPVMKAGAHVVMEWTDGTVFAATYEYGSGRVVYINDLWIWYGGIYWQGDQTNGYKLMQNALAWISTATDVKKQAGEEVQDFSLFQNYPNPFNVSTTISYHLPGKAAVTLKILDMKGRTVRVLENKTLKESGRYTSAWDGKNSAGQTVPSGVYLTHIRAGDFIRQGKIVLTK
jgi:hypothetical protein